MIPKAARNAVLAAIVLVARAAFALAVTRGPYLQTVGTGVFFDVFRLPKAAEAGGVASGSEAYYSFDAGNVHFVCLDAYDVSRTPGSPMLTWLAADLAATAQTWIVAYWHHPPYTKGTQASSSGSRPTAPARSS